MFRSKIISYYPVGINLYQLKLIGPHFNLIETDFEIHKLQIKLNEKLNQTKSSAQEAEKSDK